MIMVTAKNWIIGGANLIGNDPVTLFAVSFSSGIFQYVVSFSGKALPLKLTTYWKMPLLKDTANNVTGSLPIKLAPPMIQFLAVTIIMLC